jgi:hypothetical protein
MLRIRMPLVAKHYGNRHLRLNVGSIDRQGRFDGYATINHPLRQRH